MLTRLIASFVALALIGLAAALPALAQSGGDGDSSGAGAAAPTATATTTATPTATATPAPGPTSFAITPAVGTLKPRALTRLGDKWYVAGYGSHGGSGRINVFSNNGTFEKRLGLADGAPGLTRAVDATLRGLTNDGTNLIAVTGGAPGVHTWNPSTDSLVSSKVTSLGNNYRANGIAHDKETQTTWIAVFQLQTGTADLLKLHGTTSTLYRTSAGVNSLTHQNGFLYATQGGADNPDLLRIKISDLSPHTPAALLNLAKPPMNTWETVKRNAGLRRGLVFHNGKAYGFNADHDEVRAERDAPTTTPAATPAPTTGGAAPAPNPATPSSGADANPSG